MQVGAWAPAPCVAALGEGLKPACTPAAPAPRVSSHPCSPLHPGPRWAVCPSVYLSPFTATGRGSRAQRLPSTHPVSQSSHPVRLAGPAVGSGSPCTASSTRYVCAAGYSAHYCRSPDGGHTAQTSPGLDGESPHCRCLYLPPALGPTADPCPLPQVSEHTHAQAHTCTNILTHTGTHAHP